MEVMYTLFKLQNWMYKDSFTNLVATHYLYKVSLGLLEAHLFKNECPTACSELLSKFMKNIYFWTKPKVHEKY